MLHSTFLKKFEVLGISISEKLTEGENVDLNFKNLFGFFQMGWYYSIQHFHCTSLPCCCIIMLRILI